MATNPSSAIEAGVSVRQALWNGQVIAEAPQEDLILIERNWYFPPDTVGMEFLQESPTPYTCPWKGPCQYFNVGQGDQWSPDSAWSYPELLPSAVERVHRDFAGYIAFWRDVTVTDVMAAE